MKKTVSISVDADLWKLVREMAWSRRESTSGLMEKFIKVAMPKFTKDAAVGFYGDKGGARKPAGECGEQDGVGFHPYSKDRQVGKKGGGR